MSERKLKVVQVLISEVTLNKIKKSAEDDYSSVSNILRKLIEKAWKERESSEEV